MAKQRFVLVQGWSCQALQSSDWATMQPTEIAAVMAIKSPDTAGIKLQAIKD